MADAEAPFYWKQRGVDPAMARSTISACMPSRCSRLLVGEVARSSADMAKPYADAAAAGGRRARGGDPRHRDACCCASTPGASGLIALNRSAWGRKGRIFVQIFGATGHDRLRPGADERDAALHRRRAAATAGLPHAS